MPNSRPVHLVVASSAATRKGRGHLGRLWRKKKQGEKKDKKKKENTKRKMKRKKDKKKQNKKKEKKCIHCPLPIEPAYL